MKRRLSITLPRELAQSRFGNAGSVKVTDYSNGSCRVDIEGEFEFHVVELDRYVQVEFLDPHPTQRRLTRQLYTYKDGTKDGLQVGDLVNAATVYQSFNRAIVRELGSGISPTAATRSITKRLRCA
jgi:hypothetical protein